MCKLSIWFMFMAFSASAQPSDSFSKKFGLHDSVCLFLAILRSDSLRKYFPQTVFTKYYDNETHTFKIGCQPFYKEVEKYYSASRNKQTILRILGKWRCNDSLLNKIQEDKDIQMEEVFYENERTRRLFKKYLRLKEQSWESLSSWQSYELYIDFMNYAASLSLKNSQNLFYSLRKTANRLQKEGL